MKTLLLFLLFALPCASFSQITNDEPCTAIALPVLQGAGFCQNTAFALTNASFNPAYPVIGCPSNPQSATPPDVWFKFAVPASGSVKINTSIMPGSVNDDGILYAYSTSSDCTGTFTFIGCDDDAGTGENAFMPILVLSGLQPGDTIFLQFIQYNGANNGNFNICISDPNPPLSEEKVGIGISLPDSALDVNGNTVIRGGARVAKNLQVDGAFLIKQNAGAGKVLTSDAQGFASWQNPATSVGTGTANQTLRHNGTGWVASNILQNDASTVTVSGNLKISSGSPGTNKILTSDASGNASWKNGSSSFYAVVSASQPVQLNIASNYNKSVSFTSEQYDDLGEFNDSVFTALNAGTYLLNVTVSIRKTSGTLTNTEPIEMRIISSPGIYYRYVYMAYPLSYSGSLSFNYNGIYRLNAGQILKVQVAKSTNVANFNIDATNTNMSVTRLH